MKNFIAHTDETREELLKEIKCSTLEDLFKQVTNNAGKYQIKNTKNAMMLNLGGSATTNYCFIVGKKEE